MQQRVDSGQLRGQVRLWAVEMPTDHAPSAKSVEEMPQLELEAQLENLVSAYPGLISEGMEIVGRQVPLGSDALDLLGVDVDGRLVVLELKRGNLAREAVAQVLDYSSYLAAQEPEVVARLVEASSGKNGVERIPDFQEWYAERHQGQELKASLPPRMVLVGLGTDDHALRMVQLLASSTIDITLVTFQAFRQNDQVLLAQIVQAEPPRSVVGEAQRAFWERVDKTGVRSILSEARSQLREALPQSTEWVSKTTIAYALPEQGDRGRNLLVYTSMELGSSRGRFLLIFYPRAMEAAGDAFQELRSAFQGQSRYGGWAFPVSASNWTKLRGTLLGPVLTAMVAGWRSKEERKVRALEEG